MISGPEHAAEIASLVARYAKANAWRKPEQLRPGPTAWSTTTKPRAWRYWNRPAAPGRAHGPKLRADQQAAYYQLVLHPIRACANLNGCCWPPRLNQRFARQAAPSTNGKPRACIIFAASRRITRHLQPRALRRQVEPPDGPDLSGLFRLVPAHGRHPAARHRA